MRRVSKEDNVKSIQNKTVTNHTRYALFISRAFVVTLAIGISFRSCFAGAKGHHHSIARRRRLSSDLLDYPTRSIRSRGARAGRGRAIGPKNIIYSAAEWRASEVPGPRAPRAPPDSLRNRIPIFFVDRGLRSIRLNAGYVIVFTHP